MTTFILVSSRRASPPWLGEGSRSPCPAWAGVTAESPKEPQLHNTLPSNSLTGFYRRQGAGQHGGTDFLRHKSGGRDWKRRTPQSGKPLECAWKSALSEFQSWDFTTRRRCSLASPALLEGDPDSTAKHLEPAVNSGPPQPPACRGD